MLSADAQFQKRGNEVAVVLGLELAEDFEKREHAETVTVRTQKRLAVGFFPGSAEFLFVPQGALQPVLDSSWARKTRDTPRRLYVSDPRNNIGGYVKYELFYLLGTCGLLTSVGTVYSLICAPFDDWKCGRHDFVDPNGIVKVGDAYDADSPKLRALLRFSKSQRNRIGIITCLDNHYGGAPSATHFGLIGIHKHLAVFVDGPTAGPTTVIGTETKRRSGFAAGPFIVELKMPDLGFSDWKRVAPGETQAAFSLPAVERDCTVEVIVSFREDASANGRAADDLTRQVLAKAAGREWRFDLALKGTGLPASGPTLVRAPAPQPAAPLFEVVEITPKGDGQYFVRVAIKDKSKTFSVRNLVKPEVSRLVREDFRSKHPEEPARFVRENMRYETENDGDYLACTGWVFSVRPTEDGWHYDAASRTGWIRLRVTGGIPASEAEAWAHENIAEIVKYKNAVLEPGKAPPPGAAFRSLGEKFEDGILTIEFEAVQ